MKNLDPDYIDLAWGIPLAIILWVLLVLIILVSLRRRKVKRDRQRYIQQQIRRRETFIAVENGKDEEFLEQLSRRGPQPEGNNGRRVLTHSDLKTIMNNGLEGSKGR